MISSMEDLTAAIEAVVAYNWNDEQRDYEECIPGLGDDFHNGRDGHIFLTLQALRKFVTPDSKKCVRCGSRLQGDGYCSDETCPHSDYLQDETWTEG